VVLFSFFLFGKPRADDSLILQYKQEPVVIIKLKYVANTGQLDGWWMDGEKHFPFGFKFPSYHEGVLLALQVLLPTYYYQPH
jgi:hypothetical protein